MDLGAAVVAAAGAAPVVEAAAEDVTLIEVVQLEALALFKIVKSCREALPNLATGQLLGLDVGKRLEVTNCFPFLLGSRKTEEAEIEYQQDMMKCLREVNADNNSVGWYQSTYLGSYLGQAMIESQYQYQVNAPKSVVIIYDSLRTNHGAMSLRAFRLSKKVMDLYRDKKFTYESLQASGLTRESVFEEIPIVTRNSLMVNALMTQLEDTLLPASFDHLELTNEPYIEKNLEFMIECVEEISQEQTKYQYYQRNVARLQQQLQLALQKRKYENQQRVAAGDAPLPDTDIVNNPAFKAGTEPSRLEYLLVTHQIDAYCKQINQFAGQAFPKLFLASGLQ
eukprot:Unigene5015_Nuclearia_a/m.15379 Unigene5015_Nuclearia_a/g.15379  ORF Unigene5015_Nuclearia_a/g.15379 Unigene5015_Nuclearia_a/m.15379 type:complete len:338 (-) Unigene5015_Nuclearia_a:32-1045(-)